MRVHIAAVGYEVDRVVLPSIELKAEKVVLISNLPKVDKARRFRERVIAELDKVGIRHEVIAAPNFDLDATLDALVRIIRNHRDDSVYINISAGSKIQALAGLLAAMIVRVEGLTPIVFYAEPTMYADDPPTTPISSGLRQLVTIPALTLPSPPPPQKAALELLSGGRLSKLELALALASMGFLDASKLGQTGKPRDERARVSLQAAVDQKVIQPMIAAGYFRTERVGRKVLVSLTDTGNEAASLFSAGVGPDPTSS